MTWQESARHPAGERSAREGIALRHGVTHVAVSDIASVHFCELKLDHRYTIGEIPSADAAAGTALHEELIESQMVPVAREDIIEEIDRGGEVDVSLGLEAVVEGLPIRGRPDWVCFSDRRPCWVVELKTTGKPVESPFPDHLAQAQLYGLLLEETGFDCSGLQVAVVYRQRGRLSDEERAGFLTEVTAQLRTRGNGAGVHTASYQRERALAEVRRVRSYWFGDRAARPSASRGKCASCAYGNWCPASRAR